MLTLLPDPQEIRHTESAYTLTNADRVLMSPWNGEDAAEEVLVGALRRVIGRPPLVERMPLGGVAGATVAVARNERAASTVVRMAVRALQEPVPTAAVWRDGPCMPAERTLARRIPLRNRGIGRDETYVLLVHSDGIAVTGSGRRGLFWGLQTLRQVLAAARNRRVPGLTIRDWPTQEIRGVHLDMKYFFQTPAATEEWLRGLSALKINCVLFEYEDKFPYRKYAFLRDPEAMVPARLRRVLDTARRHHIMVIPLVQSLGHLEFALRHPQLAHLREEPDIYFQACPTNPDVLRFVCDLIDEVMDYHLDVPFFHIGADETGFLGKCPRCARVVKAKGETQLYLDHITRVVKHVIRRGKRPIMWEDIVRVHPESVRRLPRETVLAYWDYGQTCERHYPRDLNPTLARFYRVGAKSHELWPDTLSIFEFFDYYRKQGFDVLAMPCLNYGTLVPNIPSTARNTLKFAEKAAVCGGLGTINTQWACFRLPFDVVWYNYGLTAQATWFWPPADTVDFETQFSRLWLGMSDNTLVDATNKVAEGVGFRARGARPFNLLHFAIMDAELHYERGMEDRRRRGSMPRDMNFTRVLREKLRRLAELSDRGDIDARTAWVEQQMRDALHLLKCARPTTPVGRRMKDLLKVSADFKLNRIATIGILRRAFSVQQGGRPTREEVEAALRTENRLRRDLQRAYSHYLPPGQLKFEMRLLFEGEENLLREVLAGSAASFVVGS